MPVHTAEKQALGSPKRVGGERADELLAAQGESGPNPSIHVLPLDVTALGLGVFVAGVESALITGWLRARLVALAVAGLVLLSVSVATSRYFKRQWRPRVNRLILGSLVAVGVPAAAFASPHQHVDAYAALVG